MLKNKVIIVTGAGQGLGKDFALGLAAAGAKVVVNDVGASLDGLGHDPAPAQSVVEQIRAAGGEAVSSTDSVAEWDSAQRIVGVALEAFGRIDGVVNNAGIVRDRFFFKMTPEEWHAVIAVHLHGTFYVSRAAAPYFKEQGSGAYVHVTSTSGLIGNNGQANYAAAKLGIVGLSHTVASDMARYGVRSNCIAPFAWTRMTNSIPPDQQARVERLKLMDGAKVAPLATYLLSEAAVDVTAQVFCVRANEIFLMSQSRPVRSVHRAEGWTPRTIAEHGLPALRASLLPLEKSGDVFTWDPV